MEATGARIAAVGAGRMGRGIAISFAFAGYPVDLIDLKDRPENEFDELKNKALDEIRATLTQLAEFGMLSFEEIDKVAGRVSCHPSSACQMPLSQAEFIFEGVPETLDAKQTAFALICRHASHTAVLASTTSTILSTELQQYVSEPERFLNAHWLNPAYLVPLVELSPGENTDSETTQKLKDLLESIGKVPVVCAASPGYIVPRLQTLVLNEAARMVEEGVATAEDIDKATLNGFGFRFSILGLLEFIDWGGGDILYYASRYMHDATGEERYASPEIVEQNMHSGRTGLRDRRGFLDYNGLDIESYQKQRLKQFVAMLQHVDKLPVKG